MDGATENRRGKRLNKAELNKLGDRYYFGEGVPKDDVRAAECWAEAAKLGDVEAQCSMGFCYKFGKGGIPQDLERAAEWYTKSANQGNSAAQYFLAGCYRKGEGVPKNERAAIKWYKKAAAQGDDFARIALREMGERNI